MQTAVMLHLPATVPSQCITALGYMRKFHHLLGRPSYGFGKEAEDTYFHLVEDLMKAARSARSSNLDPIDIPYTAGLEHVPCVPSWTVEQIRLLAAQELVDPWVAEKYWVRERIQDCDRVGKDLSRMQSSERSGDWYPDPTAPALVG